MPPAQPVHVVTFGRPDATSALRHPWGARRHCDLTAYESARSI